ncbi:DUF4179 domain-containing protein [Lederbergia citri]|uniref:DUF4179 domain-containing protein n=1 Tax=Lederbergia citri TaxID=2833580 RepID=A0A942YIE5_9BACI|nr:DUF4179 domain-containing protein [Lederbergia citri]MBS4196385.1 DUF4179 domain-containing protein [Lederbergia citri]
MSNEIKREIEEIQIPLELHRRSKMGIQQALSEYKGNKRIVKKWANRRILAASVLVVIILSSAVFNTQVLATIQKALQYIPGIGTVVEDDAPQERYVLDQPISTEVDGGSLVVTGMVVDDEMTYITMNGTNVEKYQSVKLVNGKGEEYTIKSSQMVWGSNGKWTGSYWHEGKLDLKGQMKLIIAENPEIVIPLTLNKAKSFDRYQDMGGTAAVNGVTITAIANKMDGLARVALVSQQPKDLKIIDFGIDGVHEDKRLYVADVAGKVYPIQYDWGLSNPVREFYFDLSGSDGKTYNMTIPEINVTYDDKVKLSLDIPSHGVIDVEKSFEIAGFPATITKLERINDDQLRLYVNLNYNEQTSKSLHNFRIDSMSHMAKINEQTKELEYLEFDIKPNSKKVKITLTEPEVIIRGPWKFELPYDKYFSN